MLGEAGPFLSPHIKRQRNDTSDQEDEFETRLELLASILEAVDKRSHALAQRASAAEQDAESNAQRSASMSKLHCCPALPGLAVLIMLTECDILPILGYIIPITQVEAGGGGSSFLEE